MATKKENKAINKTIYKARALVYIKYDGKRHEPGSEFEVQEKDVQELQDKMYVQIEKIEVELKDGDENQDGADKGEGAE